ncbi:hypothetical protein EV702DRAFT_1150998 [Suillus placidus]|uniref:Uncharacterized protein n=1 Tax=Suillus placidus TaxID=48579 RepID=A0A9P6ZH15_9AGAM|nr:hypothetical protein EV702DRAFT_1150998 [Suillus placidus]
MSATKVKPTTEKDVGDGSMSEDVLPSVQRAETAQLEATLDAALELYDGINDINLDGSSPLSSPHELSPMDHAEYAVNNPHYVTDNELAAEMDARDGKRRSSRPKQSSAPRAAPAPVSTSSKPKSRHGQSGLASGSVRSSIAPSEASYSSKRSRHDSGVKSPDNKKKRKASSMRNQSELADSELVDIHPDM